MICCPYCNQEAALVSGNKVYPHRLDLISKMFWECKPCDARVGCHPHTIKPLGRLANAELREAKMKAHAAFDPLWKLGTKSRSQAYAWLAEQLNIAPQNCHIGMFDVAQCVQTVAACKTMSTIHQSPFSAARLSRAS